MPYVEVDDVDIASGGVQRDSSAVVTLLRESLRQPIARPQLHRSQLGMLRIVHIERLAQVVVLQIAVAVFVDQDPPFATSRLGNEDAGAGQAGRMVLDELHVL